MRLLFVVTLLALLVPTVFPAPGYGQAAAGTRTIFTVSKKVADLPGGPLFWRLETFADMADAQAGAGPLGLVAEGDGQAWLFTLGPSGGSVVGGTTLVEIGPVPVPHAQEYELRVVQNVVEVAEAGMAHTHPGPESIYVQSGEVIERTASAETHLAQGEAKRRSSGWDWRAARELGRPARHHLVRA